MEKLSKISGFISFLLVLFLWLTGKSTDTVGWLMQKGFSYEVASSITTSLPLIGMFFIFIIVSFAIISIVAIGKNKLFGAINGALGISSLGLPYFLMAMGH